MNASASPGRRRALAALGLGTAALVRPRSLLAARVPRLGPLLFVSHGTPATATENTAYTKALRALGAKLGRPKAIVVISAHYPSPTPLRITAPKDPKVQYDFKGYPPQLSTIRYNCPGLPLLAIDIQAALWRLRIPSMIDGARAFDHGVWVPLRHMLPDAKVPVLEISVPPNMHPAELARLGAGLTPVREKGVVFMGSGGVTNNDALLAKDEDAATEPWAKEFDDWIADKLVKRDDEALYDYKKQAPNAAKAAPTSEHLDPLFLILGAALPKEKFRSVYEGFRFGSLSLRTFALGV